MTVVALPLTGFAPTNDEVAKHLRSLADEIEQQGGYYGDLRTVVLIMETKEGLLHRATCGAPCDLARVIGLLNLAAVRAGMDG